ncbi:protein NinF [Escherichia coli]
MSDPNCSMYEEEDDE